jgi:hypothetical protein
MPTRSVFDAIRFHRMTGDDGPLAVNWRQACARMAEELEALSRRLDGSPGNSRADEERIARAALVLREYRAACAELDNDE